MPNKTKNSLQENKEVHEVSITDLAVGGRGVARLNGKVVFVEKGLPGQRVKIQIFKNRKDYAEGRVVELVENSPLYEKPRCDYFDICGGCSLQNMKYGEQLRYKQRWIKETLERVGGLTEIPVGETIPSPDIYFYRNKMEFSFSDKVWSTREKKIQPRVLGVGLGLHLPGRYDTIINIDECFLQSDVSNRVVRFVREFAVKSGLPAYNIQRHKGFWRFLIIREGKLTGESLLNLITNRCSEDEERVINELAEKMRNEIPEVTAFFHAEHYGKSQAAIWENVRKVYGKDFIQECIGEYIFRVDCGTFFQTNSRQVEKLYETVKDAGKFTGKETVYDLFSGAGTIPIYLSPAVCGGTIVGMELDPRAVEVARANAALNNVTNCHFIQGKVRSLTKHPPLLFKKFGKPGVVIADPPRSGVDTKTVDRIIKLKAERVIYVSCNPAALARDLKLFSNTYHIEKIVPVDMFPHTAHIESVTTLIKKSAQSSV